MSGAEGQGHIKREKPCGKIFSAYIPKSRIVGLQDKYMGFPDSSDGRESAYDTGDSGSIPGLGRSPGEGNGYPL